MGQLIEIVLEYWGFSKALESASELYNSDPILIPKQLFK